MSGSAKDYPEHYKGGLKPAHVREKYYYARSPQGRVDDEQLDEVQPEEQRWPADDESRDGRVGEMHMAFADGNAPCVEPPRF